MFIHPNPHWSNSTQPYRTHIYICICFRSCIFLMRTPRSEQGGWREGQAPWGRSNSKPRVNVRKLEATPIPTGIVELSTPAENSNGYTKATDTYARTHSHVQTGQMHIAPLRGGILIRTHHIHKNLYITLFLLIIFGPYYYVPP